MERRKIRILNDTEWDRLVELTGGDNEKMHWKGIFSHVDDTENKYSMPAVSRAHRGCGSARCWYDGSASYRNVTLGFRPAIDLDTGALPSDIEEGNAVIIGTLYMNGSPVHVPQNPTWDGDIEDYIPGAKLEMREPLDDPAYQVTGILDGDKVYVDRNLLKNISYEDVEQAVIPEDEALLKRLFELQVTIRKAQEESQDLVAQLINLGYDETEIEKRLTGECLGHTKENIVDAEFHSLWNDGVDIENTCKVNMDTLEVFDIQTSNVEGLDVLDREYIILPDGKEYPVSRNGEQSDGEFWYN